MMIRVLEGQTIWPYSLFRLREDEPSRSFSFNPSDAELAHYGVFRLVPQPHPEHDPATHRVQEVHPVERDGIWLQEWELIPLTDDEREAYWRATNPPRWMEFGAAVQALPEINSMLGAALTAAPALAMAQAVGLGKAADGDSRVFLTAWSAARATGLVSAELVQALQQLAAAHDLPADFVAALGVEA